MKLPKLLIVDDVPEYVQSLKNALQSDFEITTAYSLSEAKEKSTPEVSIYLIDIRLDERDPDNYDGIVFLEWAKKKYPDKPVILMSAYKEYEERKDEILKKGAADFMKKPIFLSDLRAKLKKLSGVG